MAKSASTKKSTQKTAPSKAVPPKAAGRTTATPETAMAATASPAAQESVPETVQSASAAPETHECRCHSHDQSHRTIPSLAPGAANPYLPYVATVREVIKETHNIMTFRVTLDDEDLMRSFRFQPGQVGQLSLFGAGESTFVINSPPTRMDYLQFSVMRAGEVTAALHGLRAGDKVGVRAPLGNHFPYDSMKGKDIVFVGGGIGMAPLRTLLLFMLDNRKEYGRITLLYGARSPQDMAFSYELPDWLSRSDMETVLTIDREAEGWEHKVGLIPNVLLEMAPSPKNAVAVTCGPPIMIKFTMQALDKLNFTPEQIFTTLERRMKCGIGICGRCNIGEKYVCVDGPVFTAAELRELPNEL